MEESGKVRLVRCPKCENLLPERPHFSVYRCGGCGAVLRAKNKTGNAKALSEMSDDEKIGRIPQISDNYTGKGSLNMHDDPDADMKSNIDSLRPNPECLDKDEARDGGKYTNRTKDAANKGVIEGDPDISRTRNELCDADMRMEFKEGKLLYESSAKTCRLGRVSDWGKRERGEMEGSERSPMNGISGTRFLSSKCPNEGPSSYHSGLSHGSRELTRDDKESDVLNKVDYLDQERAELSRMLDKLKDQLTRNCDVSNKPKENLPQDGRSVSQDSYGNLGNWFPVGSSIPYTASMQNSMPEKHVTHPPYFNHDPEPYPYHQRHDIDVHKFYPSMLASNHLHAYRDPCESQFLGRAPHPGHSQYQQPSRSYVPGKYLDTGIEPFEPYPYNLPRHHPACSCVHCYSTYQHFPPHIPPVALQNRQFQELPYNLLTSNLENPASFNSRAYDPQISNPIPSSSHDSQSYLRQPSGLNSEYCGLLRHHQQRIAVAGSRHCFPVSGGAPLLTCCNCSELLVLPKEALNVQKNQRNVIRCEACSAVIKYAVCNKRLVFSLLRKKRQTSGDINDGFREMAKGKNSHINGHANHSSVNNSFDDYDGSGYEFQALDHEPNLTSKGQGSSSSQPQEMQSFHSSSLTTSEDETSPEILVPPREQNNYSPQPTKGMLSPPPPGSFHQEHFDHSDYNHVKRFAHGNRSSRSDHEKVVKATMRQNSLNEASLTAEMDVSFNEFTNTGVSQDSMATTREEAQPRAKKANESFLANIIKKSLSKSNQGGGSSKANVSINGNYIPDRLVKKAEKLAGPIRPGHYWYDYRAGFWGVMGGPCLGIIPPSIEEFNYPMSEDCAGGNTHIFVNGRGLHQKDLDLLASRGLPTERDKSYIVEISGGVWDAHTGVELECLGKLAPTVEKMKRGFGMKVPRTSAQ